jgi:hypothetical protein
MTFECMPMVSFILTVVNVRAPQMFIFDAVEFTLVCFWVQS